MSYKYSETKARARLKLIERDAKDARGKALLCECDAPLDAYELLREGEKPKVVICCRRASCDNSAETTGRIFRAEVVTDGKKVAVPKRKKRSEDGDGDS